MSDRSDLLLSFVIGYTPGAALLVWGLVLAVRPPSPRSLARGAAPYGLRLTDVNRSLVSRYLQRTGSLQLVGAGLGWIGTGLFIGGIGQFVPLFGIPLLMAIAGYLLGAVIAEATFFRRFGSLTGVRSASLTSRALLDYVPALSVWALRGLPVVLIGLAVLYVRVPKHSQTPSDASLPLVVVGAVLLVVFALAVERISR